MSFKHALGAALLALAVSFTARAQVVINEVCADNGSLESPALTLPDYVELYNPGATNVTLTGWALTDDLEDDTKWTFPAGTVIASHSYLVVWLDTTNTYPGLISTTFSLRSSGEEVALFQGSTRRDYVRFGPQIKDYSLSRRENGTTNWTLGLPTPGATNSYVTLGTPLALRINEALATNSVGEDWLELYNPSTNGPAPIGGMVFSDTNNLSGFPGLWPNSFIDTDKFIQFLCMSDTNRGDRLNFKLSSTAGETLYLYASNRTTMIDSFSFGPQQGDVSYGRLPNGGTNFFFFSPTNRVTPGAANDWRSLNSIVVNEVLTHTDPPLEDAVELLNLTGQPVDVSHWYISNSRNLPLKFRIPAGTVIPAYGHKVFFEQAGSATPGFNRSATGNYPDFTFNSAHGDEVVLTAATAAGVTGERSVRDLPAAANGVSIGRHIKSDGGTDFTPQSQRSFGNDGATTLANFRLSAGLANAYPCVGPMVFSEIMYHPSDFIYGGVTNDNTIEEYIELKNITNAPVKLFDPAYPTNTWRIKGGVSFRFPTNITVAANSAILVVNFNPQTNLTQLADFRAKYGVSADVPVFGPYSGKLNNKSDILELYKPDPVQLPPHPDAGYVPDILVEKIKYEDNAPWPAGADNTGQALQRISHTGYANDHTNWFAGPATPGNPEIPEIPPIIMAPPQSVVVMPGQDATFNVQAIGTPVLSYQWYWNGLELPGANGPSFTISPVESFYEGSYYVVIVNPAGTTMSDPASLFILTPPAITEPPVSQIVTQGTFAAITVGCSGSPPLTYNWFKSGTLVSSSTNAALVFPSVLTADGGQYHVVVTNAAGSETSGNVFLTVGVPAHITAQPVSRYVPAGTNVTFSVTASGSSPRAFQWRKNGVNIAGATATSLTLNNVQPADSGSYAVYVLNGFGSATSSNAVLSVAGPPQIVSVERLSNSFTRVTLNGVAGHIYEIQGSADLSNPSHWLTLGRLTNAGVPQVYLDASSTNQPFRFYRGKLVP